MMQPDNMEGTPLMGNGASSQDPPHNYPPPLDNIPVPDPQSSEGNPAVKDTSCKFGDIGGFWAHVDRKTDQDHEELVKGLKSNLDNLLIFAALFSAVNSTFMGFSLPALSPGPADQTNKLLQLMLEGYNNATWSPDALKPDDFRPPRNWVVINQFFSVSLTFSLLASFGALLGQQWIIHYNKRSPAGSEKERWERQRKWDAAQRWYLEPIVEIFLPGLLQTALFIFLVGFLYYLFGLEPSVGQPNAVITAVVAFFFLLSIPAALWDPYCPFRNSAPDVARALFRRFFSDRFPKAITPHAIRFQDQMNRVVEQDYFSSLRRQPDSIQLLTIRSALTLLETSEDYTTLLDTARNIPLLRNKEELLHIYHSAVAMRRLHELSNKEELAGTPTRAFSKALCHLALTFQSPTAKAPSRADKAEQLVVFERAADGHIRDVKDADPVCFLPTSVATVTFVAAQSLALGGSMWSLRPHQAYLLDSLQHSPNPLITVGLVAWMLLSNKEFIPGDLDRVAILAEVDIVHKLRPDKPKQELDDIANALRVFENTLSKISTEAESCFLRFVLTALRNAKSQARSTHKFLIVLTAGLDQLLSHHEQSWQLKWKDALYLIESLGPLLADGGSQARPLPGNFEEADEDRSDRDWKEATHNAIKLVDETCLLMKRWDTPAEFAGAAAKSDALLIPFTQYIKHVTQMSESSGRPSNALAFEHFAMCIQEIPEAQVKCSNSVYEGFTVAWREYQALPPAGGGASVATGLQGVSTLPGGHNQNTTSDRNPVTGHVALVPIPRTPAFPIPRPASLRSIPPSHMSPSQRYSQGVDLPKQD